MAQQQAATVPVRMYQVDDRIMVAAPMPGLEPENISVTIAGVHLTIRGEERGPGQHERDLMLVEWTIGPYYREVLLPQPVNGALTNATYGNGVLVLVMPKVESVQPEVTFQLQAVGAPVAAAAALDEPAPLELVEHAHHRGAIEPGGFREPALRHAGIGIHSDQQADAARRQPLNRGGKVAEHRLLRQAQPVAEQLRQRPRIEGAGGGISCAFLFGVQTV